MGGLLGPYLKDLSKKRKNWNQGLSSGDFGSPMGLKAGLENFLKMICTDSGLVGVGTALLRSLHVMKAKKNYDGYVICPLACTPCVFSSASHKEETTVVCLIAGLNSAHFPRFS